MSSFLLQITSGRGPVECAWVVARLADVIIADAHRTGIEAELIEGQAGSANDTLLSALIHLNGGGCETFLARYEGTVQWIGYSRFRSGHKRKNWFVGVQRVPIPQSVCFSASEVKMEAMRSCGPGGQHVNKTESAIRVVHLPTGLFAISRDERSQFANRRRALERISILVARHGERQAKAAQHQRWDAHNNLERGNPIRVYEGEDFRLTYQRSPG